MNTQPYPTGLTDSQWGILQDLIPLAGPGGCPRSLDMRSVVNAILYVVVGGIQWRTSPVDSLEQFLSAATGVGSPRLVCMHPELLAPETDSALATRITAMCIQRDGHSVQVLKKNRALSGCCRVLGIRLVILMRMRREHRPVSAELQDLLQQLATAGQSGEISRRLVLCEKSLGLVERKSQPRLWAALHAEMSDCLTGSPWGDRRRNLDHAIRHCRQALKVFTRRSFPAEWAMTQTNLGNAYAARIQDKHAANVERAIRHYRQALNVFTYEAFSEQWATIQNNLGNAQRSRIRGGHGQNLEQAIGHYHQALKVFTRRSFPAD